MANERWTHILVALGGAIYALLAAIHYLGVLQWEWLNKIPEALLHLILITSLISLALCLEQQLSTKRIRAELRELNLKGFSALPTMVDTELNALFGDEIRRQVGVIIDSIKDRRLRVESESDYRTYYNKALEIHPKSTFLATSLASEAYFWKPGTYEEMFRRFLKKGGRMKRIFLVEHSPDRLSDEERRVIEAHSSLGVEVLVIGQRQVPEPMKKLFIVEAKGRISWVSQIDATAFIAKGGVACSDRDFNTRLVSIFKELSRMARRAQSEPRIRIVDRGADFDSGAATEFSRSGGAPRTAL